MEKQGKKKLLVFGGTVFIGKTFFDPQCQQYDIYCLNRGSVYWYIFPDSRDDALKKSHPYIHHVYCDRKKPEEVRKTLVELNQRLKITSESRWSGVIDFSAYFDSYLWPTLVLKGLIDKYIIISTDSCYNNSLDRIHNPIKESDFDIVEELKLIDQQHKVADSYGYNKLKCQVFLNQHQPYPFVCLRIPDVLGEFDQFQSSQRVWCTLNWISKCEQYPIALTAQMKEKKLSFVDSHDVAKMVKYFLENPVPKYNAYNFACNETPTLFEFYQLIAETLKKEVKYREDPRDHILHFFPSVESGVIDCSRAKAELDWTPTPLKETVRRFVDFYLTAGPSYEKEFAMMQKEFKTFIDKYQV